MLISILYHIDRYTVTNMMYIQNAYNTKLTNFRPFSSNQQLNTSMSSTRASTNSKLKHCKAQLINNTV